MKAWKAQASAAACLLAASGCIIAAGVNFGNGESEIGWQFVVVFVVLIAIAIFFTWFERKMRGEEMRRIYR
jgi:Na+/melibiose symporter-like transporter